MDKEQVVTEALKALKKIAAGGAEGEINGNFYVAMTKKDFVLAVTLQAKDPKGMKVLGQGKAMRKELGNAKFSRGTIQYDGSQFLLSPLAGNMPGGTILQRFKKGGDDASLNRFLKRMRIAGEAAEELDEDSKETAAFDAELKDPEVLAGLEQLKLDSQRVARNSQALNEILSKSDDDAAIEAALSKDLEAMKTLYPTTGAFLVERDKYRQLGHKPNLSSAEEQELVEIGERIANFEALQSSLCELASHSGFPMGNKGSRLPEVMSASLATSLFLQEADLNERLAAKKAEYEKLKKNLSVDNEEGDDYKARVEKRDQLRNEIAKLKIHIEALSSEQALDPSINREDMDALIEALKGAIVKAYPAHGVNIYGKIVDYNAKAADSKILAHQGAKGVGAVFTNQANNVSFSIRTLQPAEIKSVAERLFVHLPKPPENPTQNSGFMAKLNGLAASGDAEDAILDILGYPSDHISGGLGADPNIQAGCQAFLIGNCHSNWFELKDWLLKNKPEFADREGKPPKPKQYMWQMWLWRERITKEKLTQLSMDNGGVLIVKSVGSKNLTSDIDITLSSADESGIEIELTRQFNTHIQSKLKAMPGVAMDVNCYPKDFLAVKDNQIEVGLDDGGVEAVNIVLGKNQKDQDKAALVKLRQYMTQEQWNQFASTEGLENQDSHFAEVDRQYFENILRLCRATKEHYESRKAKVNQQDALPFKADAVFEGLVASKSPVFQSESPFEGNSENVNAMKADIQLVYDHITHKMDELFMESRYELYLDKMAVIRGEQAKNRNLKRLLATDQAEFLNALEGNQKAELTAQSQKSEADFLSELSEEEQEAYRARLAKKSLQEGTEQERLQFLCELEIDRNVEAAKAAIGEANFFAPEAYISEGPLNHIVNGKQSNNPEIFKKLKPEHFLESINEQAGDFFKDCMHYKDSAAECFYQSSKYLSRMLEGIQKVAEREGFEDAVVQAQNSGVFKNNNLIASLATIENVLVPMRGSQGKWAEDSEAIAKERNALAIQTINDLFGVQDIGGFRAKIQLLTAKVNIYVRSQLA